MLNQSSPYFSSLLILFYTAVGLVAFYASKIQNIQIFTFNDGQQRYFFHPYMQTFAMFIGEISCFLMYYYLKKRNPKVYQQNKQKAIKDGKKTDINKFLLAIPTTCDFISTNFTYIAFNFIPPSIYSMLGGGSIITTLFFMKVFLKAQVKKYQFFGCMSAFFGMAIVGSIALIFVKDNTHYELGLQILGIIMMVSSLLLSGLFYVIEQRILNQYYIEPLQMVGYEGLFGIIYCLIFIPIFTFTPCPFTDRNACVQGQNGKYYIERPELFFEEIGKSATLAVSVVIGIIFIGFYNVVGLTITKYIGATVRPLMGLIRVMISWGISLIITQTIGKSNPQQYQWEYTQIEAIFLEGIGFLLIIFGICTYNKTLIIDCLQEKKESESQKKLMTDYDENVNQPSES